MFCFLLYSREVVQQLIDEYQAATKSDYISWGIKQVRNFVWKVTHYILGDDSEIMRILFWLEKLCNLLLGNRVKINFGPIEMENDWTSIHDDGKIAQEHRRNKEADLELFFSYTFFYTPRVSALKSLKNKFNFVWSNLR